MHAETMDEIDLKSLENLKIVNGYKDIKSEEKLVFSLPSSPEENVGNTESDGPHDVSSTSSTRAKSKGKCGRPANPIPRHKRDSHIKAEYKRRDKIQKGFDTLKSLVPELTDSSSSKESRSAMLFKTAEYCRRFKSECGSAQLEKKALQQELEVLGTEIHALQERLPQHDGAKRGNVKTAVSMDTLYKQYVAEETKTNWKFWIFSFFMKPLFASYKQTTCDIEQAETFNNTVLEWVQDRLSIKNLRKGFLDSLRYISTHTGIMTKPEELEREAQACVLQLENQPLGTSSLAPSCSSRTSNSPAESQNPTASYSPVSRNSPAGSHNPAASNFSLVPSSSQAANHNPTASYIPVSSHSQAASSSSAPTSSYNSQNTTSSANSPVSPRGKNCLQRAVTPVDSTSTVVTPAIGTGTPLQNRTPLPGTPRTCTPLQTPGASPPRTPNLSRRSSKREKEKTNENRSRSNSPNNGETKTKRRSAYRSRSGKTSRSNSVCEVDSKIGFTTTSPPSGTQIPFTHYLQGQVSPNIATPPQSQQTKHKQTLTAHCLPEAPFMVKTEPPSITDKYTPMESNIDSTLRTMNDTVVSEFVKSLIDAMKPHSSLPDFESIISEPSSVRQVGSGVPSLQTNNNAVTNTANSDRDPAFSTVQTQTLIPMEHQSACASSSVPTNSNFVPLDKSAVIVNGTLMQLDEPTVSSAQSYHDNLISDYLSMDTASDFPVTTSFGALSSFCPESSTTACDSFPMISDPSISSTATMSFETTPSATGFKPESGILNNDEDSMMNMCKIDVMDVKTVLDFFDSQQSHQS